MGPFATRPGPGRTCAAARRRSCPVVGVFVDPDEGHHFFRSSLEQILGALIETRAQAGGSQPALLRALSEAVRASARSTRCHASACTCRGRLWSRVKTMRTSKAVASAPDPALGAGEVDQPRERLDRGVGSNPDLFVVLDLTPGLTEEVVGGVALDCDPQHLLQRLPVVTRLGRRLCGGLLPGSSSSRRTTSAASRSCFDGN